MKVTPLDIKKQEFSRGMRGYDPDEVRAFLQMVAGQMEQVIEDQHRQETRYEELVAKLRHYERVEEALQATLETARQNADVAQQTAEAKAELIIEEARGKADEVHREGLRKAEEARAKADEIQREGQRQIFKAEEEANEIVRKAESELRSLKTEIKTLVSRRDELLARLRGFLSSELELLERFHEREPASLPSMDSHIPEVVHHPEPEVEAEEVPEEEPAVAEAEAPEAEVPEAEGPSVEGHIDAEVTHTAGEQQADEPQEQADMHEEPEEEMSERDKEEMRKIRQILDDLD